MAGEKPLVTVPTTYCIGEGITPLQVLEHLQNHTALGNILRKSMTQGTQSIIFTIPKPETVEEEIDEMWILETIKEIREIIQKRLIEKQ